MCAKGSEWPAFVYIRNQVILPPERELTLFIAGLQKIVLSVRGQIGVQTPSENVVANIYCERSHDSDALRSMTLP